MFKRLSRNRRLLELQVWCGGRARRMSGRERTLDADRLRRMIGRQTVRANPVEFGGLPALALAEPDAAADWSDGGIFVQFVLGSPWRPEDAFGFYKTVAVGSFYCTHCRLPIRFHPWPGIITFPFFPSPVGHEQLVIDQPALIVHADRVELTYRVFCIDHYRERTLRVTEMIELIPAPKYETSK